MSFSFRTKIGEAIFQTKYKHAGCETWPQLAATIAEEVCQGLVPVDVVKELTLAIENMEFVPGGRYLYYAGRPRKYYNNCFLLKSEEDTKEDWAALSWKAERCLTTGGGIGNDYSVYRGKGSILKGSGGEASGPLSKAMMINEIGRHVMQGGSRRSAIYGSIRWGHPDAPLFLKAKDWASMPVGQTGFSYADVKAQDFNFPAPLDCTNISINYDTAWLEQYKSTGDYGELFKQNIAMAMRNGEPGFSFNFYQHENETLRNA